MPQKLLLEKIDSLKKEADSLKPLKPEYEKVFWDKFRLEFNYNSNHLEGNTLTYDHTQLLLLFDKVEGDYSLRELEEMKAHDVAFKVTKEGALIIEHILNEKFIKEINKAILVRPFYKEAITPDGQPTRRLIEPGEYKKYPNSVRLENGELFNYASPQETPALMGDLIEWYRKESDLKELHPLQLAAIFHYQFVRIHPFDDGNGRTSRLLMNYVLMRNGFAPVVIESIDKKNYLTALNKADTGNIEAFVEYIIKLSFRWQELYLKALKGEEIEEPGDFEKDLHVIKKKIKDSKDKIEKVLNYDVQGDILAITIPTVITKLINKLSVFDDVFVNSNFCFYYYYPKNSKKLEYREIPLNQDDLENLSEKLLDCHDLSPFYSESKLPVIQTLYFKYEHLYLKNKRFADFDYTTIIKFTFKRAAYKISLENSSLVIEKLYNEELSKEEVDSFVGNCAKNELREIKSKI